MTKFIGWDIEISKEIPQDCPDWQAIRPLGISCASLVSDDFAKVYYGGMLDNTHTPKMNFNEIIYMMRDMQKYESEGYKITTWNGLSFDFNVLAEESGLHKECSKMALQHIDMMFQVFCVKGFTLGMNTAAKGMNLAGKTEGMHGDLAPIMWANGDYDKVLEYVTQDSRTTLELAKEIEKHQSLSWIAKSGRLNYFPIHHLLTVEECLKLSLPDTSWMSNPIPRSKFHSWLMAEEVV